MSDAARALVSVSAKKISASEEPPIRTNVKIAGLIVALAGCTACGGGGGGGSGGGSILPAPAQTPIPPVYTVTGTVVQIPVDAYGPAVIAGVTYASADAGQTTPLSNATVIVGPVPVVGATPPAILPPGDVATVTNSAGAFSLSLGAAPGSIVSSEQFAIPQNSTLSASIATTGYYIEVFGIGTDGKSPGSLLPLHKFVSPSSAMLFRISSSSFVEASALATLNLDRAANAAGTLTFDEAAEEAARLHSDDSIGHGDYLCHYDLNNVGPSSRYLAVGGIGLSGENMGIEVSTTALSAVQGAEASFMSEKSSPPGSQGHYVNNIDPSHLWAGIAVGGPASTGPFNFNVDYELITPSSLNSLGGSSGYTTAGCSSTIVNNFS